MFQIFWVFRHFHHQILWFFIKTDLGFVFQSWIRIRSIWTRIRFTCWGRVKRPRSREQGRKSCHEIGPTFYRSDIWLVDFFLLLMNLCVPCYLTKYISYNFVWMIRYNNYQYRTNVRGVIWHLKNRIYRGQKNGFKKNKDKLSIKNDRKTKRFP